MSMSSLVLYAMAAGFVASSFALVALAVAFTRMRETTRRDVQRLFEQMDLTLGELRNVSDALAASVAGLGDLRASVDDQRRAPPLAAASPAAARSYDIALRLARNGASRDELMAHCGMSRHEAELAVRLHGPARKPETPRLAVAAGQ